MKLGLYKGDKLSNAQYHAAEGFFSSSQFKTANEDIELFHKKYISKEIVDKTSIPAFDIGTYFHTAILEPHLLDKECVVMPADIKQRRGEKWETFKKANDGKVILSSSDFLKAQNLVAAAKDSPVLMDLLQGGESELSLFHSYKGLKCKVRADYINLEKGYIVDLKSTTGNCKDEHKTQGKISNYSYDLSAAFYIDVFNDYLGKLGKPLIHTFYWGFASKDYCNSKTYPSSEKILEVGRAKYEKGLKDILKYQAQEWQFYDELAAPLEPPTWEYDQWIKGSKNPASKFDNVKPNVRQSKDGDLL